jgi:hypothetical protein
MQNKLIISALGSTRRQSASWLLVFVVLLPAMAQSPRSDNGIHVGEPKIYDSRALNLMLEDLAQSLRKTSFVDPKALAGALGNLQGFRNDDFSQAFQANGAVGPGAASVFSGAGAPAATATPPPVSITVSPVLNAGSTATPAAAASGTPLGPQPPALPTLQTAPAFTPNFGPSGSDLLADEVNLTYQFDNIRMLLDRSLSDRLYKNEARLQAVVGFDIDLEPPADAKDSVAIVEVTATMAECGSVSSCDVSKKLSLVAMMPEEGSHNAATLSQKANAFGGAIASSVFSVGYAAQKRSQVFYLYRDMDTLSFQKPADAANKITLGWQFRPVLGRRSVASGMRHMMAVLALPSNDLPPETPATANKTDVDKAPALSIKVTTSWVRYGDKTQTIGSGERGFWQELFHAKTPQPAISCDFNGVMVPTTTGSQRDLAPQIDQIKWARSDAANGVAIVSGRNFFPDTALHFGTKSYSTRADGLVIMSDQQLQVPIPLSAAVAGGVLSGRYGAVPLEARDKSLPSGFEVRKLVFSPTGNDMYQVDASLYFVDDHGRNVNVTPSDLKTKANPPVVLVNGLPSTAPYFLEQPDSTEPIHPIRLTTFVPASAVKAGPVPVTVSFPFAGPAWSASSIHYDATLKVTRLGGKTDTRLLISATDETLLICDSAWILELDGKKTFHFPGTRPLTGSLQCVDQYPNQVVSFDVPTADLKQYHRFALVNTAGKFPPLVGDIPAADPPPPGPELDKDQKISVSQYDVKTITFKGKNLDQVKKVIFDKSDLHFTPAKDGKSIVIGLSAAVTSKAPRSVELQLISDDNDPVIAPLTVTPAATSKASK